MKFFSAFFLCCLNTLLTIVHTKIMLYSPYLGMRHDHSRWQGPIALRFPVHWRSPVGHLVVSIKHKP